MEWKVANSVDCLHMDSQRKPLITSSNSSRYDNTLTQQVSAGSMHDVAPVLDLRNDRRHGINTDPVARQR